MVFDNEGQRTCRDFYQGNSCIDISCILAEATTLSLHRLHGLRINPRLTLGGLSVPLIF